MESELFKADSAIRKFSVSSSSADDDDDGYLGNKPTAKYANSHPVNMNRDDFNWAPPIAVLISYS